MIWENGLEIGSNIEDIPMNQQFHWKWPTFSNLLSLNHNKIKVLWKWKSLSGVRRFVTPWTVAWQAPLSMEFSRPEYGLPFPSPGDLPDPGIELGSPALQADSSPAELPGKPQKLVQGYKSTSSLSTMPRWTDLFFFFFGDKTFLMKEMVHWFIFWYKFLISNLC